MRAIQYSRDLVMSTIPTGSTVGLISGAATGWCTYVMDAKGGGVIFFSFLVFLPPPSPVFLLLSLHFSH